MSNSAEKLGLGIFVIWALSFLSSLALSGVVIYVVIHFINKAW